MFQAVRISTQDMKPVCEFSPMTSPFVSLFSLQYNDYVHFVEPCFKGILVQADRDNREVSTAPLSVTQGVLCMEAELGWDAEV